MNRLTIFFACVFFTSCQFSNTESQYKDIENRSYHLRLNPSNGSRYNYEISSHSSTEMEIDEKKSETEDDILIGMQFTVTADTSKNYLFKSTYNKIRMVNKKDGVESVIDADNAMMSNNPVERMLGTLKQTEITTVISPAGETKDVKGYQELGDKLISGFAPDDFMGKQVAQQQWEQFIGKGVVKKNMAQLFQMFPDSAIHIGDKWKITADQFDEFGTTGRTSYLLKEITDGIAVIESKGDLNTAGKQVMISGYSVIATLSGEQTATYQIDVKTGMVLKGSLKSALKGNIQMMGREIPVDINNVIELKGQKL